MSDRFVISHSGKKGGPWEANGDYPVGFSTDHESKPPRGVWDAPSCGGWLEAIRELHPSAKVFRLVRRSKATLTTLERAVVEAADAELAAREQESVDDLDDSWGEEHERRRSESTARAYEAREAADAAIRALRAKRGG